MIRVIILSGIVLLFLASVGLVARLVASLFSAESERRLREHRRFHAIWFAVIPIFAVVWIITTNPFIQFGPPTWWERRTQRQAVLARVQSAGGWETLKKDCIALYNKHKDEPISYWGWDETNGLPASILALKPKHVELYSAGTGKSGVPFMKIRIFGAHSTGGHSIPRYGLEVICSNSPTNQGPDPYQSDGYESRRKITEGVYEVY